MLPAGDPASDEVRDRLAAVAAGLDPWWRAVFEPPVWAVAGNVIGERPAGVGSG